MSGLEKTIVAVATASTNSARSHLVPNKKKATNPNGLIAFLERKTRFELATFTLAR